MLGQRQRGHRKGNPSSSHSHRPTQVPTTSSEESSLSDEPLRWIDHFMADERHKYFCRVYDNYINDNFNIYGLRDIIPYFRSVHNVVTGFYDR